MPSQEQIFMGDLGAVEVPDKVLLLADFLRWNDTTIQMIKRIFEIA